MRAVNSQNSIYPEQNTIVKAMAIGEQEDPSA
jgi:hypothetical protein